MSLRKLCQDAGETLSSLLDIIVKGLAENGKTIILITHRSWEEIKKVADRCAILNRGRLIDVLDETSTREDGQP